MSSASQYHVRRLASQDAESLLAAVKASPELGLWMPWCTPDYSLVQAEAWIRFSQDAWASRSEFPLTIVESGSGRIVGGTGINQINRANRIGNIGYWVSTPHTGLGVAQFAARQAALIGFRELEMTRLEIVALTHNLASIRVAESLGAQRECTARNRLRMNGKPQDAVVFSLVPEDVEAWPEARFPAFS